MKNLFVSVLLLIVIISISGCMLGPDFERPVVSLPEQYQEQAQASTGELNLNWWNVFSDPQLRSLIQQAIDNNRDLLIASARIESARALLGVAEANQLPQIGLGGGARRLDVSNDIYESSAGPENNFVLVPSLLFDIDPWGRLRRTTRAQEAELLATEYGRNALTISLISQVAVNYFNILGLSERIAISEKTLKSRKSSTNIISARFKQGMIPELDLNQAQIQESYAAVSRVKNERALRLSENALAILLGVSQSPAVNIVPLQSQVLNADVPTGFPAALLERRPDLRAAEERARAAVEKIGAAEAARLPSFSLSGFVGFQGRETGNVFDRDSLTWSVGGGLLGPLLDWGRSLSQVEYAEAEAKAIKYQYEQSVIAAVQQVENALISIRTSNEEYRLFGGQLKAATNASKLSHARYDDGVTSYLEVLDIERSLFESELGASSAYEQYLTSIVALYAALGAGWDSNAPAQP